MIGIQLNPQAVLEKLGVKNADPELVSLMMQLWLTVQQAPNKAEAMKQLLRKALTK